MLRYDIINYLIQKYGYKRYLEIGVEDGHSLNRIKCDLIHGVDPASKHATFQITSDQFFLDLEKEDVEKGEETTYDIIFIDGLHVAEQVDRDIYYSVKHLAPGGIIVVHDCNPPTAWHQRSYEEAQKNGCRQWNGTVWKSLVKIRTIRPDLELRVVDTDWGCGLIRKLSAKEAWTQPLLTTLPEPLDYSFLAKHRKELLNLISVKEFQELY